MDDAAQLLDLAAKPFEFFLGDAVMLRVAGLDVSFLEFLEARTVAAGLARPDPGEPRIDPLGLRAQEAEIVDVWRLCRAAHYAAWARDVPAFA